MKEALIKTNLLTLGNKQQEDRECGLRALAEMIAAAYRRRVTGETGTASTALRTGEENHGVKVKTAQCTGLEDLRPEGSYTETVRVEHFLRRKVPLKYGS